MSERKKVEIGFSGGQVTAVRVEPKAFEELQKAVAAGDGWHQISSEDGEILLNLAQVVFLRIEGEVSSIGF